MIRIVVLEILVGDVLADVRVIEARRAARRCLGVGDAGGRLRCGTLGLLGLLGLRAERVAVVCVDELDARLGPRECVRACRGVVLGFGYLPVGLLAQRPALAEQNFGFGEVVAILEESPRVGDQRLVPFTLGDHRGVRVACARGGRRLLRLLATVRR